MIIKPSVSMLVSRLLLGMYLNLYLNPPETIITPLWRRVFDVHSIPVSIRSIFVTIRVSFKPRYISAHFNLLSMHLIS